MIRQGRSALRTTVVPVLLVGLKMDQTKAGNGNFSASGRRCALEATPVPRLELLLGRDRQIVEIDLAAVFSRNIAIIQLR